MSQTAFNIVSLLIFIVASLASLFVFHNPERWWILLPAAYAALVIALLCWQTFTTDPHKRVRWLPGWLTKILKWLQIRQ
jgi:sugar phosphate permease